MKQDPASSRNDDVSDPQILKIDTAWKRNMRAAQKSWKSVDHDSYSCFIRGSSLNGPELTRRAVSSIYPASPFLRANVAHEKILCVIPCRADCALCRRMCCIRRP